MNDKINKSAIGNDKTDEPKFDTGVYWVGKNSKMILLVGTSMFLGSLYLIYFVMPKVLKVFP